MRKKPPEWDGSLNATMLSRVWVERAGSESAVFGGARPLSDLVDMPIDTVYMSYGYAVPCYAMLCLCLLASLFLLSPSPFPRPSLTNSLSLSLSLSLPPRILVLPSSCVWPPCSSILLISPRDFFVPSFPPSHVISPSPPHSPLASSHSLPSSGSSSSFVFPLASTTSSGNGAGALVEGRWW